MNTTKCVSSKEVAFFITILEMLVELVKARGEIGAPGGHVYADIMVHVPEMTAAHFESLMTILVNAEKVTKRGQLYFAVKV